jgi:heme-degrading monooxygenase HmoA
MSEQSVIFLNTFEVEPDRQSELLDLLGRGADQVIRHRPGFIALTLLARLDGRRVINLAHWESADHARATQGDPQAAEYAARAAAIATPAPGLYRLVAEIR